MLFRSHDIRAVNAAILHDAIKDLSALRAPIPPPEFVHAWYRFYSFVKPEMLRDGWNRDRLVAEINGRGVPCFYPHCTDRIRDRP